MSLYNMLFGQNPDAGMLLNLLGKTQEDFGRYRDIFVQNGYIVVHTRNGGGNREYYEHVFDEMAEHPWYSHDEDDDFDCTYANIYFKVPEETVEQYKVAFAEQGHDPSQSWETLFKMMEENKEK